MTNYNDGKWHGWNGGECPVHPETVVDITYSDGQLVKGRCAENWSWNHPLMFRVVKEYKGPREFWIGDGYCFDSEVDARLADVYDTIHVREVLE